MSAGRGLFAGAAWSVLWTLGCGSAPVQPAQPAPAKAPAVEAVLHHDTNGKTKPDSPFFVVLTRPVDPAPDALVLVDDAGARLSGETTWLAPQLVAFYPHGPFADGLTAHLRTAVALRAPDGSTLPPAEIASVATPPIEATPDDQGGSVTPLGGLRFSCERLPPASEIEQLGVISIPGVASDPIAFEARVDGTHVRLVARSVFPPGATLVFGWRDGPIAKTTIGRIHLEPVRATVGRGFELRVGEHEDGCSRSRNPERETWTCTGDVAHLVFSTPISDDAIAQHVHPPQPRATTGDLRGYRLEVTLGKKPVSVSIDAALEDGFGQRLPGRRQLTLQKLPPP